ncbi:hypothetical protein HZA97_05290 [Candidatus Woesearchaeota archaeon]|nr:hypothetical protein [Candidatus Woesearchaeota archaeon]
MIKRIEYLVKPFQDSCDLPINGCKDIVENPFEKISVKLARLGMSSEEYLELMASMWKKQIDRASNNLDLFFVMIDIFRDDKARPMLLLDLRAYAKAQLRERFLSMGCGYDVANHLATNGYVLANPLEVHAYGEISDRCARGELNEFKEVIQRHFPDLNVYSTLDTSLCPDCLEGKF